MYRTLLRYNLRICTGLGSWLLVVPVGATMLVLFGVMAMVSVLKGGSPGLVLEAFGPILLAFVSTNLLRPEYQYGTLELALARPVSFRAILSARVLAASLVVIALVSGLGWYMQAVVRLPLNLPWALLATTVSMAFLASLAIAIAAAWRSPMLGLGVAAAFWALDLVAGPRLNPLLTLHGYEASRFYRGDLWDQWWLGKLLLAGLTVLLVIYAGRAAARPALQRTLARWVRTGLVVAFVALVYIATGAAYKVQWGIRHEAALQARSRFWYQQAFSVYGPVPVAYLMGPSFAHFVGYRAPWTPLPPGPDSGTRQRLYDELRLREVAFGPASDRWADNALLELGRRATSGGSEAEAASDTVRMGIGALETLAREHPTSPLAPLGLEKLAAIYAATGRPADADNAVRRLVEVYPTTEAARRAGRVLLDQLMAQRRAADALPIADRLLSGATPDARPDCLVDVGCILAQLGRTEEATAKLNEALTAVTAATQALNAGEKSLDDITRMRKLVAARRRATEQLTALQAGVGVGETPGGAAGPSPTPAP